MVMGLQVRVGTIRDGDLGMHSKILHRHSDSANKLALEPENPNCFYSCGSDGSVSFARPSPMPL